MQFLSVFVESRPAVRNLLQLGMLCLGCCLATFGQEATIVGTVTDPSGSVVPNVTISVTHTGTGQTRTLATKDAGQYVAPDLVIGNYAVKAEAPSFKTTEKKNIVLNVNDRTRIDFVMQVGSVQESVTVEANAVAVQSDSGDVSTVITGQQVTQLSTNGRSLYNLYALTPGGRSGNQTLGLASNGVLVAPLNHTQFQGDANNSGISVNQGAGNFGAVTSAFDPRDFQLGVKLFF